jgi:lysozyme
MCAWRISDAGVHFICNFEGFRAKPYQDSGGVWTIGYGTTVPLPGLREQYANGITEKAARDLVLARIDVTCGQLEKGLPGPWLAHQMDAILSLVYNIGVHAFNNSTIHQHLLTRATDLSSWKLYVRDANKKTQPGLIRRREKELMLFIYAIY